MSDSWGGQDQPPADRPFDAPPPGYGAPQYGQPPPGQPPYGQAPPGQPPYGQVPPGQPSYGQAPAFGVGGYGPPMAPVGGWAQPASMPGGVPLRPLAVGDILSGAFTLIRRNPLATLGIAAIVETVAGVASTFFSWSEQKLFHNLGATLNPQGGTATSAQVGHAFEHFVTGLLPFALLTIVLTVIAQGVLTGALTGALGRGLIGDKITIGQALRMARVPTVIGVSFLIPLILIVPWLVLVLIVVGLAAAKVAGLAIFVGVVGGIALFLLTIWAGVRLVLCQPIVVLEVAGPIAAMRRSWQLVKGHWWRTFGIFLLATIVVTVIAGIIEVPFSFVGVFAGGRSLFPTTPNAAIAGPSLVAIVISGIGGVIATTCTRPISAGVLVLQYADLRMRKEGFDLVLQQAGQDSGMSGSAFTNVWAPGQQGAPGAATGTFGTGAPTAPGW